MQKLLTAFVIPSLVSGTILLGFAQAQTSSSGQTTQPSTQSSTQSGGSTTAKKPATAAKSAAAPFTLKTQKDKESYAVGMSMGQNLLKQQVPVDPAIVLRGLKDALANKAIMKDEDMRSALQELRNGLQKQMQAKSAVESAGNKKEGDAFLAANKSKEGVVALPDGLQYKILTAGSGPKPSANDTVTVNYRGTLINGKEFDSSYKRGQPASFPVGGVIKGWTEALQLMPVGSKWQLFIPSDLAYGDRGAGADIAPGSTLIFEVELISIGDQKK
jgi:FKBP-type peptidyl-prolyl cis-trans isomerase FklB